MNQIKPLLSIRFMIFNNEDYIKEAIEGILIQKTDFSVEVVVGDDFSTDRTLEIVKSYSNTETITFKILDRKPYDSYWKVRKKKGRIYNFIDILNNCEGKYIALLDGDDYWSDPLKLQKQVDFLEGNPDYSISFHNVIIYNEDEKIFEKDTITRRVETTTGEEDLAKGNYIHSPSVVLRNDFKIPSWFDKVHLGDWSLYMLSIKGRKVYKFEEEMAVYRLHSNSIWSKLNQEKRNSLTKANVEVLFKNLKLRTSTKNILRNRLGLKVKKPLLTRIFNKLKQKISRFV